MLAAIMWPILVILYYKLTKREEKDLEKQFGTEYMKYKERVPMFIPFATLPKPKPPYAIRRL